MAPQRTGDAETREFLRRHGYVALSRVETDPPSELAGAVAEYQRRQRLHVSGELDASTRAHLSQSRCGWVDRPRDQRGLESMN